MLLLPPPVEKAPRITIKRSGDVVGRWLFYQTMKYLRFPALEIDSATSAVAERFMRHKIDVAFSNGTVNKQFKSGGSFTEQHHRVFEVDLSHPTFNTAHAHLIGRFETIVINNFVTHEYVGKTQLANIKSLLGPKGLIIVILPAPVALYNFLDEGVTEWRGSNRMRFRNMMHPYFNLRRTHYFEIMSPLQFPYRKGLKQFNGLGQPNFSSYSKMVTRLQMNTSYPDRKPGLYTFVVARVAEETSKNKSTDKIFEISS